MNRFFDLKGTLDKKTNTLIGLVGLVVLVSIWVFITSTGMIKPQILPSPFKVLTAFVELHFKDALVRNLSFSIYLNYMGYIEAVIFSLVVGFILGLFPLFRSLFSKYVDAIRFLPLTALTGLFIAWFGIGNSMKIQFLAFGIFVYLVPVVIQRIDEVDDVYDQTAITLGASMWQRIIHVFIPSVMSKISDDIRVLVAISWTYIIVAELINAVGGIGPLTYICARSSQMHKVFALLIVIITVGFIQDKIFKGIDRLFFKHKYL
jgi:NitT/TauT family transport system permease protein